MGLGPRPTPWGTPACSLPNVTTEQTTRGSGVTATQRHPYRPERPVTAERQPWMRATEPRGRPLPSCQSANKCRQKPSDAILVLPLRLPPPTAARPELRPWGAASAPCLLWLPQVPMCLARGPGWRVREQCDPMVASAGDLGARLLPHCDWSQAPDSTGRGDPSARRPGMRRGWRHTHRP